MVSIRTDDEEVIKVFKELKPLGYSIKKICNILKTSRPRLVGLGLIEKKISIKYTSTEEILENFLKLRSSGYSLEKICETLKTTRTRLKRLGLCTKKIKKAEEITYMSYVPYELEPLEKFKKDNLKRKQEITIQELKDAYY